MSGASRWLDARRGPIQMTASVRTTRGSAHFFTPHLLPPQRRKRLAVADLRARDGFGCFRDTMAWSLKEGGHGIDNASAVRREQIHKQAERSETFIHGVGLFGDDA